MTKVNAENIITEQLNFINKQYNLYYTLNKLIYHNNQKKITVSICSMDVMNSRSAIITDFIFSFVLNIDNEHSIISTLYNQIRLHMIKNKFLNVKLIIHKINKLKY